MFLEYIRVIMLWVLQLIKVTNAYLFQTVANSVKSLKGI